MQCREEAGPKGVCQRGDARALPSFELCPSTRSQDIRHKTLFVGYIPYSRYAIGSS